MNVIFQFNIEKYLSKKCKKFQCHNLFFLFNLVHEILQERLCCYMSNKSVLKVQLLQEYDLTEQRYIEERNVIFNAQALQGGLVSQLGATETAVLLTIASFCDIEGEAFPSQRKLAELTGLSLPTVNKAVARLLETKIDGKPIIARELESMGSRRRFSVYSLCTTEEEAVKKRTAKDFAHKFKVLFEEEFGFPYVISYARDLSLIKKKLMVDFTEEQIDQVIEYTIKNYKKKWANSKFPYPTITMLGSWLSTAVMKEIQQEKEKAEEVEKLKEETAEFLTEDYSKINELIDL